MKWTTLPNARFPCQLIFKRGAVTNHWERNIGKEEEKEFWGHIVPGDRKNINFLYTNGKGIGRDEQILLPGKCGKRRERAREEHT